MSYLDDHSQPIASDNHHHKCTCPSGPFRRHARNHHCGQRKRRQGAFRSRHPLHTIQDAQSRRRTAPHDVDANAHQPTAAESPDDTGPQDDVVFAERSSHSFPRRISPSAARYLIERHALVHADHGLYANDLSTGQPVVLRFCSRCSSLFERIPRMCHELAECRYICK